MLSPFSGANFLGGQKVSERSVMEFSGGADVLQECVSACQSHTQSPVLVCFYAPWCGTCKMFGREIPSIVSDFPTLTIIMVDVDANKGLASAYKIMGIPTLWLYAPTKTVDIGKATDQVIGYNKVGIRNMLHKNWDPKYDSEASAKGSNPK